MCTAGPVLDTRHRHERYQGHTMHVLCCLLISKKDAVHHAFFFAVFAAVLRLTPRLWQTVVFLDYRNKESLVLSPLTESRLHICICLSGFPSERV
eukprot:1715907-Amphidinium_carterae.1